MTFMLDMAITDLGELEASYDESDKLAFRLESTYANVLLELTDLTNLQQIALKSQGSISDSTFQLALDISQPILAGTVVVNGVEYVLNLEPNTGALVIPEICEVEYALTNDNSVAKISIDSPIFTLGTTVSLGDYSCMTKLTTASYKAMLQTDGLNFSLLRTKVTDGNKLLFELNFDGSASQYSMNYPSYPVSFQLTTNSDISQVQGDVIIGESSIKINSLDILVLPASGSVQLLTYGQDFGIDFTVDTAGFTADFQSNTFNVNAQTTQHLYLEPLSVHSGLKLNAFGQKMEGLLTYEDGMTNIDATVSALPIVAGVFALEMDGFTLNTLAMENVNFNLMKLMMVGGASYRDGVVYLSKSQIRNTETGDMYYGLSSPIEFDLESGLAPMSNVIIQLGAVRFEVTFEDNQNFELIQRLPTEDIYVSAQDGVYAARFTIADFNFDSQTSMSPMKQMLTVTYHNDEVFALDLQAELPKSLKLEASSGDKQMLFQFSGARYSLDATAPGIIEMSIQGNGLEMIAGHITTSMVGIEMDLKQDLADSSLVLVADGVEIIQFNSQAMDRFNLSVQAPQTGSFDVQRLGAEFNFELNAYPYAMVGKGDLSQRHIKIAISNGQTTLATIEGEIQQDNISATLVASNNQLRFGFIPSEHRLRYVVEVLNHYSSNGDFSPTQFNSFELTGPQGSILCDADQCEIKSDDLNMHSTLVFGESFSFYFGGMDPSVTLVDLKMTGSAGSLKVIFYDIVKAHIERKGNKIAGKGLVLDTQLNLESTIGQTLFVSANGPTAEFTIEADREHAEWNMTRPVENVATITRDELVVVALDRRFSVTSVDGLLNVQSELA